MEKTMQERKEEDIIAIGNKLIAEFMGCYVSTLWAGGKEVYRYGFKDTHITERWNESEFATITPYHTSWDWLMPVVEKIESIGHKTIIGGGDHWGSYCNIMYAKSEAENKEKIYSLDGTETKALGQEDTKLKSIYSAVVQFIKWHNTQSSNTTKP